MSIKKWYYILCYYIPLVIIGKFLGPYESIFIVFLIFLSKKLLNDLLLYFVKEIEKGIHNI